MRTHKILVILAMLFVSVSTNGDVIDPVPCGADICLDPITVSGSSGGAGGGLSGAGGSGGGGGGSTGGGGGPTMVEVKDGEAKLIDLIKKNIDKFCKKSSESCEEWGARMLTPAGLPVPDGNGIPTTAIGAGLCQAAFTVTTICQLGVIDISMSACAKVECPKT
jgi:hypothetical protein